MASTLLQGSPSLHLPLARRAGGCHRLATPPATGKPCRKPSAVEGSLATRELSLSAHLYCLSPDVAAALPVASCVRPSYRAAFFTCLWSAARPGTPRVASQQVVEHPYLWALRDRVACCGPVPLSPGMQGWFSTQKPLVEFPIVQ